jgi:hypothetical protein
MHWKAYLSSSVELLAKIWKAIKDAWKRIVFSLIGKVLPIYLGFGILFFFPKNILIEGVTYPNLFKPVTLIVYSATFFISAIFLWFKNLKRKDFILLLFFFIFYMTITALFVLSYIKDIQNKDYYQKLCEYTCLASICLYVYHEIKNSYYIVNTEFEESRDEDLKKLKGKFKGTK